MNVLARKLTTAKDIFDSRGTKGVLSVLTYKLSLVRRLKNFDAWRQKEHWWVGMMVVATGDVVRLDSCTFRVRHPAIRTSVKSLFFLNAYERPEREILKEYLDRSLPVVELGGSIGVVACVTNRMLDAPQKHVVVEANPDLIGVLQDNRARNQSAFTVLDRVLAYGADEITFYKAPQFLAGSVQVKTGDPITVPAISLRQIIEEYGFDRCTVICDIEGGEMDLVSHESDVLKEHVDTLIVEIHGWRVGQFLADEMIRTLEDIGFCCVHRRGDTRVFRNRAFARLSCGTEEPARQLDGRRPDVSTGC